MNRAAVDLDKAAATGQSAPPGRSTRGDGAALVAAAVIGAVIWALSPDLTGKAEPWDAEWPYLSIALAGAGLVLGLAQPRRAVLHWLGIVLGQLLWQVAFLPLGPLIVLGVVFLVFWSLLTLVGSWVGSWSRRLASRLARGHRPAREP